MYIIFRATKDKCSMFIVINAVFSKLLIIIINYRYLSFLLLPEFRWLYFYCKSSLDLSELQCYF